VGEYVGTGVGSPFGDRRDGGGPGDRRGGCGGEDAGQAVSCAAGFAGVGELVEGVEDLLWCQRHVG